MQSCAHTHTHTHIDINKQYMTRVHSNPSSPYVLDQDGLTWCLIHRAPTSGKIHLFDYDMTRFGCFC